MNPPGAFQRALLAWFQSNGRDLPWRRTRDPYAILVSEVMLQQTQVERVLPRYVQFLERFPTFQALAEAGVGEAIRAWEGLGYNQRAVRLWRIAQAVVTEYQGRLPREPKELRRLPGVGAYTSAAVSCFAFGGQSAVVDTNVRRVLGRRLLGTDVPEQRPLDALATEVLPAGRAWEWNQALMDLGATVCISHAPRCLLCPVRQGCAYAASRRLGAVPSRTSAYAGSVPLPAAAEERAVYGRAAPGAQERPFKGSSRYYRGRLLDRLRALPSGAWLEAGALARLVALDEADVPRVESLLAGLERDGLVRVTPADSSNGPLVSLPS